jgi:hypothetical protein
VYKLNDLVAVTVEVKVYVKPDADIAEVLAEMDYNFNHSEIVDTEIVDVSYGE